MREVKYSEKVFDSMINRVPDIIYQLDRGGCISFINKAVEKYGFRIEELLGTPILEWVHPDDRQRAAFHVNERRTGDRSTHSLEIRLQGKNPDLQNNRAHSNADENAPVFLIRAEGIYRSNKAETKSFMGTQGLARHISHERDVGVKAVDCLNNIRRLFENSEKYLTEILQEVVDALSSDWPYGDGVSVRLIFDRQTYVSKNFREKEGGIDSDIILDHEKKGTVEIFTRKEGGGSRGGFLPEGHHFLNALSKSLGGDIKRKWDGTENERESRFLFSVLESLPHPFYVVDVSDYRVLLANTAAKQGRSTKNSTCYALSYMRSRPCGTPKNPCPVEIIKEKKEPVVVEHIHYDENNNPRFFKIRAYPVFDNNGNVSRVIESSIDITDQKQIENNLKDSELKFRAVAQSAKDAIVSADSESAIAFWNQSAEEMFGYSEAEIMGKPITVLMPGRYKEAHLEHMKQHVTGNGSPVIDRTLELVGLRKDGQEFPLELSVAAWKVGDESFYTGILRDISERKQTEREREKLISDLQKALARVKTLSGLLPICASCKKIRDDKGYWNQIETYIHEHSNADFSHGICPECAEKLYPEVRIKAR